MMNVRTINAVGLSANTGLEEMEPGLRYYDHTRALRRLDEVGWVHNNGFSLAYLGSVHPYPIGLCYYICDMNRSVSVHICTPARVEPLKCKAIDRRIPTIRSREDQCVFKDEFLRGAAQAIGTPFVELVNFLANRNTDGRFEGWVDGKSDGRRDNSGIWRPLWEQLTELIPQSRAFFGSELSDEGMTLALVGLNYHVAEGQRG